MNSPSFRRKPETSPFWTPAFAGVTSCKGYVLLEVMMALVVLLCGIMATVESYRASLRAGQGISWQDVDTGAEPSTEALKVSDKPRTRRR